MDELLTLGCIVLFFALVVVPRPRDRGIQTQCGCTF